MSRRLHKTGVEGVFRKGGRFVALIYVRGERRFLGKHRTLEGAAAKVAKMALAHHGEWAA